jgi:hypothetical protein
MEHYLGRFLTRDEVIHHINKIKTDNRIENLELTTNSQHKKIHQIEFQEQVLSKRICEMCGTNKTYRQTMFTKHRSLYLAFRWFKYKNGYVCAACYMKWYRSRQKGIEFAIR